MLYIGNNAPVQSPSEFVARSTGTTYTIETTTFTLLPGGTATFYDFDYQLFGSGTPNSYGPYSINPAGGTLVYTFVDPDPATEGDESNTLCLTGNSNKTFSGYSATTSGLTGGDYTGARFSRSRKRL